MSKESVKEEIKKLDLLIEKDSDNQDYFLERAKLKYKLQDWAGAINDYTKVLELDPENLIAKTKIEFIKLNFKHINQDVYENTNLYKDPWFE